MGRSIAELGDFAVRRPRHAHGATAGVAVHALKPQETVVFRHGAATDGEVVDIRRRLDPNESSRWAIAAAALLLCLYSIVAGPLNFAAASKKGTPLRALRWLPIFAAGAFALIVGIGIAAKGFRGRARHLTLIEAGAGSPKGTARRWRGASSPLSSHGTSSPH